MAYDLVIKNGMVIDGSGLPRYRADVGVRHGKITTIGRISELARETVDAEGHVVTNNHVAEKATEIKCVLSDKEEIGARLVGLDPETDLAVIQLNLSERKSRSPLPVAEFGDSTKLRVGEFVMAMGAPHGF